MIFAKEFEVGVGASTSIFSFFGTFIGFVVLNWQRFERNRYDLTRVVITIGIILLINLMLLSSSKSIDNYAHGGGFIAGLTLSLFLGELVEEKKTEDSDYEKKVKKTGVLATLIFTAVCVAVCFV